MSSTITELLRYGATIGLGLAVDLAVATLAAGRFGASLELAAILGVAAGAAVNYALLNFWAFRGVKSGRAAARPVRFLGVVGATMAVRAAAVMALESALPEGAPPLAILLGAVAVSFAVGFLLSKYWAFRVRGAAGMTTDARD